MRKQVLTLVGALIIAVLPASAQTADEIVARALTARGGLEKIKSVETERVTGEISFGPNAGGPFTVEFKRPGRMRMEITFPGATLIRAYDGKAGWFVNPLAGKTEPETMSAEDARHIAEEADFDGALVDYKAKGNHVELAGKESVGGREAWKLKVALPGGGVRTHFLDATTYLPLKWEGQYEAGGESHVVESFFSDYREVGGLKIPFAIDSDTPGTPDKQRITIQKIEVNPSLDDARFVMPAAPPPAAPKPQ